MHEITRIEELNAAIEDIQHRWGQSAIQLLKTQAASFSPVAITTGLDGVDGVTCIGGLPRGISTFWGSGSSGIVTLAFAIMGHTQASGNMPVFMDLSYTFDGHYAQRCGVNLNRLLIVRPTSLDEGCKIIYDLVESQVTRLIVLDYAFAVGSPRSMVTFLQRLANRANVRACAVVCLVPHYAHPMHDWTNNHIALSMQVEAKQWHYEAGDITGCTLHLTVKRNKFAPAGRSTHQRIRLEKGMVTVS